MVKAELKFQFPFSLVLFYLIIILSFTKDKTAVLRIMFIYFSIFGGIYSFNLKGNKVIETKP